MTSQIHRRAAVKSNPPYPPPVGACRKRVLARSARTEEIELAKSTNPAVRPLQQSAATLLRSSIVVAVTLLASLPCQRDTCRFDITTKRWNEPNHDSGPG